MSSPQRALASSQFSSESRGMKSRFTYKHLTLLASSSTISPLRVIAHVDLDAFYAQCEMVRLGVAEDQPLAVQQWSALIAVNYPSREFGISRMLTATEAKKLCPNLICQHVATWREGDEKWAYHDEHNIATHKASLDPYRLESRKILACIKEALPTHLQKVEKAGIDEVFLDLSAQVHSILLERYPELAGPALSGDPTECLPRPPTTALDWNVDALVDLDTDETEDDDPDWDDVALLIGSEIVRKVRAAVREELKYTCSGGVAQNKMLAKLGSGYKKPNQQTIIRNRAVQQFLSAFKFTKIRGLGGKLGDEIKSEFSTDTVKELLLVSLDLLKQKLGDESGTWIYHIIRGNDSSEVNPRTQIKSMLSAKSFRPTINTTEQAARWLRIFVSDIYSRLVEEGVLENKRRPKTLTIHHRQGGQTKSRQAPIPLGRKIDEAGLSALSRALLDQIILEGQPWPCAHLSLAVGGFEDGVVGNMGIGSFLVKGEEAKALAMNARELSMVEASQERPGKRRRNDLSTGIGRFFKASNSEHHDDEVGAQHLSGMNDVASPGFGSPPPEGNASNLPHYGESRAIPEQDFRLDHLSGLHQQNITDYMCVRCRVSFESATTLQSHQDWHFAKDLEDEERVGAGTRPNATIHSRKSTGTASTKKNGRSTRPEKGQSKLAFG